MFVKEIFKKERTLNKKSQPVSLLADSKIMLIKINNKWGYFFNKFIGSFIVNYKGQIRSQIQMSLWYGV